MSVTCVVHHGEVDRADTVELPGGPVCIRCYGWMESLLDDDDDTDEGITIYVYTEAPDDDDYDTE